MKRNVLQLIGSFHQGGSELQAVQLTHLLHKTGHYNLEVACLDNSGVLRAEIDRLDINLTDYPLTSFSDLNFIAQLRRFVAYLRKHEIDIVHTHDFYTNIFGMAAARLAGVRVRIASRRQTAGRVITQRVAESVAYRLSHAITANCEAARSELIKEGVTPDKITTIHNGLNLERVTPRISRNETLARFNLPSDRRFVTIVANLRLAMKDHPTFIRAANIVRDSVPGTAFVVAGEGDLLEPMRVLAANHGLAKDMFFIGHCDRLAELLDLSQVCVLSSASEGFSNAILEYLAASRPTVATNVGGAREAIVHGQSGYLVQPGDYQIAIVHGQSGYLVQPGDYQDMAARITYLLRHPVQAGEIGKRGRAAVEQKFSCDAQIAKTLDLYESLLAVRQPFSRRLPIQSELTRGKLL